MYVSYNPDIPQTIRSTPCQYISIIVMDTMMYTLEMNYNLDHHKADQDNSHHAMECKKSRISPSTSEIRALRSTQALPFAPVIPFARCYLVHLCEESRQVHQIFLVAIGRSGKTVQKSRRQHLMSETILVSR